MADDVYKRYRGKRVVRGSKDYKNGTWYVCKRIRGVLLHQAIPEAATKEAAQEVADKLIADAKSRRYGLRKEISFKTFADVNYRRYCEESNESLYTKELFIKIYIEYFGNRLISEITTEDCANFRWTRLRTPLKSGGTRKPSSVNREVNALKRLFNLACEQKYLSESPMAFMKRLEDPPPRRRRLSSEQRQKLYEQLEKDIVLLRIVTLALNLPLRRKQILAITPEDCDFEECLLWAIKSKRKPAREVPMNQTVMATLRAMIADGQLPFSFNRFEKRWHQALLDADINKEGGTRDENFHFHDLRHVFGSELLKNGVNPYIIKELFGHSDMKTSAIYISAERSDLRNAVNSLDVQEIGGVN